MKKMLLILLFLSFIPSCVVLADAPFHIGLVTASVSQAEDAYRGAERLVEEYGRISDGGMFDHLTLPDNFAAEMETTINQIVSFAEDPLMKAIVLEPGMDGTVEAFRRVRALRPDILLLAGEPAEDPLMLAETADLSIYADLISRGYTTAVEAKKMGADTLVYIAFPRAISIELIGRHRDITAAACEDLGLTFINVGAPDPASDVGVAGAQQFILEKVPAWIEQYGIKAAFFAPIQGHQEPLIRRVLEGGAIYLEPVAASPTMGYPGALGISFEESEKGDWPKILGKVEEAVIARGGNGRMATWAYSLAYSFVASLGEHAKRVIEGQSEILNIEDIMDAFSKYTPGAEWKGSYLVDPDGIERENYLLLYQDTYVHGLGYLKVTSEEIPEKYYDPNIGKK